MLWDLEAMRYAVSLYLQISVSEYHLSEVLSDVLMSSYARKWVGISRFPRSCGFWTIRNANYHAGPSDRWILHCIVIGKGASTQVWTIRVRMHVWLTRCVGSSRLSRLLNKCEDKSTSETSIHYLWWPSLQTVWCGLYTVRIQEVACLMCPHRNIYPHSR